MDLLKIKSAVICAGCFISLLVCASELAAYGDWRVQVTPASSSVEAYVSPDDHSTFGLYCHENQCVFYLHDALLCQPGLVSPVLMSSVNSAASLSILCSQVHGKTFRILDPFVTVLNAVKQGGVVSFAMPLQNGTFGIVKYSLQGSDAAIKRALYEAAQSKQKAPSTPPTMPPSDKAIPGSQKLEEIKI